MKEGSFEYKLFQKIKNKQDLDRNETNWIIRLLELSELNEEILNQQIGLFEKEKKHEVELESIHMAKVVCSTKKTRCY